MAAFPVIWLALALCSAGPERPKPPRLALHALTVWRPLPSAAPSAGARATAAAKRIQLALPAGWEGDLEPEGDAIWLYGPNGEGEMLVAAVSHPSQLGAHLDALRSKHPGASPSPPSAIDVRGIDPQKGERATRFEVTGQELGELVTIERGAVIVLIATIVSPEAWTLLKPVLAQCYPSVRVSDGALR